MYNFLLIEDSVEDAGAFQDTVRRLNIDKKEEEQYQLNIAETYSAGVEKISEKLDGIIVDIKLDGTCNGNDIIRMIVEKFRVPVVIFTGTPDVEECEELPIKIYKKGEVNHEEILSELIAVSKTGLFNVLGGNGKIESVMNQIFWRNLYPQIELWKDKREQGVNTETILLRYVISHIQEIIDNEMPAYVTEEMYISPPIDEKIKTGSIIQSKEDNVYYMVLSPPCDLVVHNGKIKTDYVLICKIDSQDRINDELLQGVQKKSAKEKKIATALNNNHTNYYHWLPQNTLFEGGYVNFRKVATYSPEDLSQKFYPPKVKVQESFVKSILNRFSSYYARQGQPDFNFNEEAKAIVQKYI